MDITMFLEPVEAYQSQNNPRPGRRSLGESVKAYNSKHHFPDLDGMQLALIGVREDRNAINNQGCSGGVTKIREAFYQLFNHWPGLKMVDLGDIKPGYNIEDTYFALAQVIGQLMKQQIVPIVIGGSQDLTYANYMAYENIGQLVNIVSIDPIFDLGNDDAELSSQSYLSKIIMHQPNYLFNFTNVGYQTYYVDHEAVDLMKNLLFDVYRLGMLKAQPEDTEPLVRNADMLSFDVSAIRAADAPGNGNAGPNGFTGEEACRIARYAGMSDKLSSIGFYEYNPLFDKEHITAQLIAQMIWYFVEGFMARKHDFPKSESTDFARYTVKIDDHEEALIFLRSKKTDRWWIDLSFGRTDRKKFERHHFVPCSKEDYDLALTEEIPDRWWQFYQKLM